MNKSAMPVPSADYDGDGIADIAFKNSLGLWLIDYSGDGFGNSVVAYAGYGDATSHPVPGDYDGDGYADLSIKSDINGGEWKIDLHSDNFDVSSGWNLIMTGVGNETHIPVPANYNNLDSDGKKRTDLSVKTNTGSWYIFHMPINPSSGIINWTVGPNQIPAGTYGGIEAMPVAADYNGDGFADFGFVFPNGRWYIDNFSAYSGGYEFRSYPGKLADDFTLSVLNPTDVEAYSKIKNCHFNITIDAMVHMETSNQRDYHLALLENQGLNTMLTYWPIYEYEDINNPNFDKVAFADRYSSRTSDVASALKDRIFAVNLGDEPNNTPIQGTNPPISEMNRLADWNTFFTNPSTSVGKPVFTNLLPIDNFTPAEYNTYLSDYESASPTSPFISYDQYPFRTNGFFKHYFYNLAVLKQKFKNRALWATVYSTEDLNGIPNPNEKQMRFMAFCPIAYGAKGITYYAYDKLNSGHPKAINDDEVMYGYVKNINLYLKNIVGPAVMGSTHIATLHKANTSKNYPEFPFQNSELIGHYNGIIENVNNDNIMVGLFAKNDTTSDKKVLSVGNYYLWVVNKDDNSASNVTITLRGNYSNSNNILLAPRAINYVANGSTNYTAPFPPLYDAQNDLTYFTIPALEAGEGTMVKLFSEYNDPTPADYDGDHITDISIKEQDGTWLIDYSSNGFGSWDWWGTGYGNKTGHPAIADYDGDGKADISVKFDNEDWNIDFSNNFNPGFSGNDFNGWDLYRTTYGNYTAHPVPADYDGDKMADLSVKTDAGSWLINFADNGYYGWDLALTTYGDATAHPVPADYDGDGTADLSVKTDAGSWLINLASNGFYGWDIVETTYGDATAHPVPADYDGDGLADLSVKTDAGGWLIDFADPDALTRIPPVPSDLFTGWNFVSPNLIYGDQYAIPVPGDYGGDGSADLSVKFPDGTWRIDYAKNGFGSWDDIILNPVYLDPINSGKAAITKTITPQLVVPLKIDDNSTYKFIAIYDLSGRLIKPINSFATLKDVKNQSNLVNGIYVVKLIVDNKVYAKKIAIIAR